MTKGEYVASLDVGTTTIRCLILNKDLEAVGSAYSTVKLHFPEPGHVEIDPNELWDSILLVIRNSICDAQLDASDISCIGISTQRSTFITWNKETGEHFHNFITWKDTRASSLAKELNNSFLIRVIRWAAYGLYILTRSPRFHTGSKLKLASEHVTVRLLWMLSHNSTLRDEVLKRNVMFGTLETWLVYKLNSRRVFVTDISNASATAFYDPFTLSWGSWAINILKIPQHILPPVVDNDHDFGCIDSKFLGTEVPIRAVMADQSASMYGAVCLKNFDLKLTLGTGAFLNLNTSGKCHSSVDNMYPLVGWKINNRLTYLHEVSCGDAGTLIGWLSNKGLINEFQDLNSIQSDDEGDVFFIPDYKGIRPLHSDPGFGFIGVTPTTKKKHILKAVLESIAFKVALAHEMLHHEMKHHFLKLCIDGGVSNNAFICQLIADLTKITVEKSTFEEVAVVGAGFIAGLKNGIWKNEGDIQHLRKIQRSYQCDKNNCHKARDRLLKWQQKIDKFFALYEEGNLTKPEKVQLEGSLDIASALNVYNF